MVADISDITIYVVFFRVAYAVNALPFTTKSKLQVKPGWTGSVAGWVTICAESQNLGLM